MVLMAVTGLVLLVGVILTLWWGGTGDETWEPAPDDADRTSRASAPDARPSVRVCTLRYLRALPSHWSAASGPGPWSRDRPCG